MKNHLQSAHKICNKTQNENDNSQQKINNALQQPSSKKRKGNNGEGEGANGEDEDEDDVIPLSEVSVQVCV